jgi:hypothetical protein
MTSPMKSDLDLDEVKSLKERCRREVAKGRGWPEILADLEGEGYFPPDLRLVVDDMDVWENQARLLKANGWPYDEIVIYLSDILATGQNIAKALLDAGVRPADMLRVVLPVVIGTEHHASVIQLALDRKQEAEDTAECRRVVDWWLGPPGIRLVDSGGKGPQLGLRKHGR